jgi:hypothetical protein
MIPGVAPTRFWVPAENACEATEIVFHDLLGIPRVEFVEEVSIADVPEL